MNDNCLPIEISPDILGCGRQKNYADAKTRSKYCEESSHHFFCRTFKLSYDRAWRASCSSEHET